MPRIRSIKPQFWTSEQIVECSPNARLLFIGLWTFCDDSGVHPAKIMRLKMQVFPADAFSKEDIRAMVNELIEAKLITEYTVQNESYWLVSGWKHQRIDQPTYYHPLPDGVIPKTSGRRRTNTPTTASVQRTTPSTGNGVRRTLGERSPSVQAKEKEKEEEKDTTPHTPQDPVGESRPPSSGPPIGGGGGYSPFVADASPAKPSLTVISSDIPGAVPDPSTIPDGLNLSAWQEYISYRMRIKLPSMDGVSMMKQKEWLAVQGTFDAQQGVVDQTVRNGWKGLFDLKSKSYTSPEAKKAANEALLDEYFGSEDDPCTGNVFDGELG